MRSKSLRNNFKSPTGITTGDLRVAALGSWLQPTNADCYLQRLPVMLRKRKTAKVQGIVQRARDALMGGPVGTFEEGFNSRTT